MAISIRELQSSDTISGLVEKINFNFDQLLLNGGGPVGPTGAQGVKGPMGTRGERGTIWFEDSTAAPGTNPNSVVISGVLEGDSYLQSNGQVWEYSGSSWTDTGINLKGPQGDTGDSAGFSYFGFDGSSITRDQEVIYPSLHDLNITGSNDDGIPTLLAGGVSSLDNLPSGASGYGQLVQALEENIDSTTVSFFIRQRDSSARSIIFSGGDSSEDYELQDIDKLVNVALLPDDAIQLNVPKIATASGSSLVGFNLATEATSQLFQSGRGIKFSSGNYSGSLSAPYTSNVNNNADIVFQIEDISLAGNLESDPKILFDVKYGGKTAQFILGDVGSIPGTSTKTGDAFIDASTITLLAKTAIAATGPTVTLTGTTSITHTAPTINLTGDSINLSSGTSSILVKNDSNNSIRLRGKVTYGVSSYQAPTADNLWNLVATGHSVANAAIKLTNDTSNESFLLSLTGQSNQVNLYSHKIEVTTAAGATKKIIASVTELASNDVNLRTGKTQSFDREFYQFLPQYGAATWTYDSTGGSYSLTSPEKSYWEFLIGQNGLAPGSPVASWASTLNLDIPAGTYTGQQLFLRVVVFPSLASGNEYTPTVNVRFKSYTNSYETESTLTSSFGIGDPSDPTDPIGSETFIHALWTGNDLSASYDGGSMTSSGFWRIISVTDKLNYSYNV